MNDPTEKKTPLELARAEVEELKTKVKDLTAKLKKPLSTKQNQALKILQQAAQIRELTQRNMELAERLSQLTDHLTQVATNQQAIHQGLLNASGAINRTERFCFSLIRVLIDQHGLQYDHVLQAIEELATSTDLEVFWHHKTPRGGGCRVGRCGRAGRGRTDPPHR
ncbi:MAG: hypothetical protein ABID40_02475 [Candidatus Bipolaricaulota bacterium]